ncbi:MAG: RDD family protein [Methanotrichaceae archaeon]
MEVKEIRLAPWGARFWAWLIDIVLVSIIWGLLADIFLPFHFGLWYADFGFFYLRSDDALIAFLYWTLLEGYCGQSLGKMVLNLKVTGKRGEDIDFVAAAIESFGKAFLLPLDLIIGWLAMSGTGQRLFNRLSNTIVIKVDEEAPEGVRYVR